MTTFAPDSFGLPANRSWPQNLRHSRSAASVILLVVLGVGLIVRDPAVLSGDAIGLLLSSALPLVLVAMAQQFVILAGDLDVGIGYSVGLANVVSATVLVHNVFFGVLSLVAIVAGYVVMALLIEAAKVPGIVITLGASFVWLGIGLMIQDTPGGTAPDWLTDSLGASLPGVPEPVYLVVALAAFGYFVLRRSRWGAVLRAFGGSPSAFVRTGRSPWYARATLYALAGVCVALAGMMTTVVFSGSDINASQTLTLTSIVAVIIGGGQFAGGIIEPVGTVVSSIGLALIPILLVAFDLNTNYQPAVEGVILILVMAARWLARRESRARR
ncbi:ABC transporter permease [Amycolatopsis sp. NPDC051903]|uniref:ABC transporter permease n=1 Tax=Amycolatopsis sp. NPDC051903 TaxID=3363936 RepID=UPI0037B33F7B